MAGGLLTFVIAAIVGCLAWLGLGARFRLAMDDRANEWLNLGAYSLLLLPFVFVVVFFLVEVI